MRATLLAAAAVAALSLSSGTPSRPLRLVDGTLALTNSRNGGPLFSAANLAPGHATTGSVTISNSGSLPGELTLSQVPSGALAGQLSLVVRDQSSGATVYSGSLTGLGARSLGRLEPGAARVYAFTAALPASAGNAGQGQSALISYTWTATEARALRVPLRLRVRVPARQHGARVVAYARCNQACRLSARATLLALRSRLVRSGRVRANRNKRLVLRLPSRLLRALRGRRGATPVTVTVSGRTDAGAHKTVRKSARIVVAGGRNRS